MTALARTGFAERQPESSAQTPISAAPLPASLNGAETREPKGDAFVPRDIRTLWSCGSSRDSLSSPARSASPATPASSGSGSSPSSARSARIAIKTKGKILLINPADILAVEARGNYALLHRLTDSYSLREPLSRLAEKLRPYGFVRIHRSVLVNSAFVEEIRPGRSGEYILRIAGGKQYPVSRTYKPNLKLLAQSWIGSDSFEVE
ncbi:MAG TPA: LytTR family DNA-binding domain-containing protein [Candidatus Acidoferrum sp.]|nr:LytTR family DNA-binding domain-containing protein [Candidatus Acidoferrum sp.]